MANRNPQFDPVATIDKLGAATYRDCQFAAKTTKDATAWQKRMRSRLAALLGYLDQEKVPVAARTVESVQREGYVRRKIVIRTSPHGVMPMYLLIPDHLDAPAPAVLALHGHGYGVKDIVGLWDDGSERLKPDGYHRDFATELALRGFVVLAPEIFGFGGRHIRHDPDDPASSRKSDCYRISMNAIMHGGTVQGIKVWENMRALDYLTTLKEVDADRIGAMGISGGGQNTLFTTALEPRIKACVISGYFCQWEGSILGCACCLCNFIPGILQLGEMSDIAALIAPRPCLAEHGKRDRDFPVAYTRKAVREARAAWDAFGAGELLQTDIFDGPHRINGEKAYDFLEAHL